MIFSGLSQAISYKPIVDPMLILGEMGKHKPEANWGTRRVIIELAK